jgi:hypothetical protein
MPIDDCVLKKRNPPCRACEDRCYYGVTPDGKCLLEKLTPDQAQSLLVPPTGGPTVARLASALRVALQNAADAVAPFEDPGPCD